MNNKEISLRQYNLYYILSNIYLLGIDIGYGYG